MGKQWTEINGWPVLIEAVEFEQLEPLLKGLAAVEGSGLQGLAANSTRRLKGVASASERTVDRASLPERREKDLAQTTWAERLSGLISPDGTAASGIELASRPLEAPAVVVDWEYLSSSTLRLNGDTTYFVTNAVNLTSPVIEGGVVVKVSTNGLAEINLYDGVDCRTDTYRPAVFTVQSDNTVGQVLPGSTGVPMATDGGLILNVPDEGVSFLLENVRFSYLNQAVSESRDYAGDWGDLSILRHAQFVNCPVAVHVENAHLALQNVLAAGCSRFLEGALGEETTEIETFIHAEQVTVRDCGALTYQDYGATYLTLTNSLLVNVTNWGNFSSTITNHVVNVPSAAGVLETVGAGTCYLVNGSTNRNAGTTNINADLLAALKKKTTYPPVVITTNFTANTTLSPQAARDSDTPDLGARIMIRLTLR